MADKNLNIKITTSKDSKGLSELKTELKSVQQQMDQLVKDGKRGSDEYRFLQGNAGALSNQIRGLSREFKGLSADTATSTGKFQSFVANTQTITQGLLAAGLAQIAKQMYEVSLNSARFEVLSESFGKQFSGNLELAGETLDDFRKATAGTVSDANLIKLSNQASDLGVGLKEQAILFSLSEDAADKYGTSVEEGFQKVILATQGNEKGLKALGISKAEYKTILEELTNAYGGELNQLDAETQQQLRLEAIIKASGQTYEDATNKVKDSADKHESLWVIAGNLADRFGGDLVNAISGVGTGWEALNHIIDSWNDVINTGIPLIGNLADNLVGFTNNIPFLNSQLASLKGGFDALFGTIAGGASLQISAPDIKSSFNNIKNLSSGSLSQDLQSLSYWTGKSTDELQKLGKQFGLISFAQEETANNSKVFTGSVGKSNTALEKSVDLIAEFINQQEFELDYAKEFGELNIEILSNLTKQTLEELQKSSNKQDQLNLQRFYNKLISEENTLLVKGNALAKQKRDYELTKLTEYEDAIKKIMASYDATQLIVDRFENAIANLTSSPFEKQFNENWSSYHENRNLANKYLNDLYNTRRELIKIESEGLHISDEEIERLTQISVLNSKEYKDLQKIQQLNKEILDLQNEAIKKEIYKGIFDSFNGIADSVSNIASTLGLAADSFVSKLINGLQDALSIVQSIHNVIEDINTLSEFFKTLSAISESNKDKSGESGGLSGVSKLIEDLFGRSAPATPQKPIDITSDDWTEMLFDVPSGNNKAKSAKSKPSGQGESGGLSSSTKELEKSFDNLADSSKDVNAGFNGFLDFLGSGTGVAGIGAGLAAVGGGSIGMSIASLSGILALIPGLNVVGIIGGVLGGVLGLLGFDEGGYTGDGNKYQPAGIVHKGEFVINKEATSRYFPLLELLNGGSGNLSQFTYANGGYVNHALTTPNINLVVNTEFDKLKSYEVVYAGMQQSRIRGSNNL